MLPPDFQAVMQEPCRALVGSKSFQLFKLFGVGDEAHSNRSKLNEDGFGKAREIPLSVSPFQLLDDDLSVDC
jgi:hypothetical protein